MAGGGDPLGRIALLAIILALMYDTIFGLVKVFASTIENALDNALRVVDNLIVLIGGGEPVFPTTEKLLTDIFSWEMFLFTNAMALAVIFFIDVLKMAFRQA